VTGNVFNEDRGVTLSGRRPVIDTSTCRKTSERDTELTFNYQRLN
jgi:hypothetical protein